MSQPSHPDDGRGGWLGAVLGHITSYADKPWKALFVLALILVCGIGFAVYEERAALIRIWSTPLAVGRMVVRTELAAQVAGVLNDTSADLVAVWAIEAANHTARFKLGRLRQGGAWAFSPAVLPLVRESGDYVFLANLLRGDVVCKLVSVGTPIEDALRGTGMGFDCVVPIQDGATEPVIGGILLAWIKQPEQIYVDSAIVATKALVLSMVVR